MGIIAGAGMFLGARLNFIQRDFDWGTAGNDPNNWEPVISASDVSVLVDNTDGDFDGNYMEITKTTIAGDNDGAKSKIFLQNGQNITVKFKYKGLSVTGHNWIIRTLEVDTSSAENLISDDTVRTFEKTYTANGADGTRGILFLNTGPDDRLRVDDFVIILNS